jgi:chromatin modification-related protein VID21
MTATSASLEKNSSSDEELSGSRKILLKPRDEDESANASPTPISSAPRMGQHPLQQPNGVSRVQILEHQIKTKYPNATQEQVMRMISDQLAKSVHQQQQRQGIAQSAMRQQQENQQKQQQAQQQAANATAGNGENGNSAQGHGHRGSSGSVQSGR